MKATTLIGLGWQSTKKYLLAACAILAMRAGLFLILSSAAYALAPLVVKFINFMIRRGFPDHLLLNEYLGAPWRYHVTIVCEGVFVLVVGMFLGLWANVRVQRQAPH